MHDRDTQLIVSVRQRIESAFADVVNPGEKAIGDLCCQIDFTGKWQELPHEVTADYFREIQWFTGIGYQFYLPMYMVAMLINPDVGCDSTMGYMFLTFCPPYDDEINNADQWAYFLRRTRFITTPQAAAIQAFIKYADAIKCRVFQRGLSECNGGVLASGGYRQPDDPVRVGCTGRDGTREQSLLRLPLPLSGGASPAIGS